MIIQTYTCPKCGRPFEIFYIAGQPRFECLLCSRNAQVVYSDHTEPPKKE